jgi:prefoldin subunit 5
MTTITPTPSECREAVRALDKTKATLSGERGLLTKQLRELSSRIDNIDRQIDECDQSIKWLHSVEHHPSNRIRS